MMATLYRVATAALTPLVGVYLWRRRLRGKEDADRMAERFGHASQPRPAGMVVWVHGASVGEALSVLPVIERVRARYPAATILMTTGTTTSAALMADRLGRGCVHQFVPVDTPLAVLRFISHWRPSAVIWTESELWPNLLLEAKRSGAKMALVNGRMSDGSCRNWCRARALAAEILGVFDVVLVQTPADAKRFQALGAPSARAVGNLKAASTLPVDRAAQSELSAAISARPCWLAASIHPGEDDVVAIAHGHISKTIPGLLSVVAPRHPTKADAMALVFARHGLSVARRSMGELPSGATDVFIVDTMGEMGTLHAIVPVCFVGKSIGAASGGQNPLEPASFGNAVLYGPNMTNFADVAKALVDAGGAVQIDSADQLAGAVTQLLAAPDAATDMGVLGKAFVAQSGGVLDTTMQAILPLLESRNGCGDAP